MAKRYGSFKIDNRDELVGDTYRELIRFNINVANDAEIKRGMLLAADNQSATFKLATASDTGKYFAVAIDNFTADSDNTVTQAYVSGVFNRERIITPATDTSVVKALELELRKQNIHFTTILKNYDA